MNTNLLVIRQQALLLRNKTNACDSECDITGSVLLPATSLVGLYKIVVEQQTDHIYAPILQGQC